MRAYLSLGSNLGDRAASLREALRLIEGLPRTRLASVSAGYETQPLGVRQQPMFLNLAAEIETALAPLELLNAVKNIELRLGRMPSERWGPRVVDIDVILYGDMMIETGALTLPHPAFRERRFVLEPLAEIAPDAVDPVTGLTVRALRDGPGVQGEVSKLSV